MPNLNLAVMVYRSGPTALRPCCNAMMVMSMTVQCSMLPFCNLHECMVSKKSQQSGILSAKRPCICIGGTGHVDDAPRL